MSATTPAPSLFADVPSWQAARQPRAAALRLRDATDPLCWNYAEFDERTLRCANALWHDYGIRSGDRVAWLGWNHPDMLVALFALARLGAVLVPLNFRLAVPELQAIVASCTPRLVVADSHWASTAQQLGLPVVAQHELAQPQATLTSPAPKHAQAQAPVLLVFTSGTTGVAKAAVHTQHNLLENMHIAVAGQAMVATEKIASVLPLFHVGGLCIQTLPALLAGAEVIVLPRFDAAAMLDCLEHDRPSLTLQVPATMAAMLGHSRWASVDLSSLRALWAGSSILPRSVVEAFHARGVPVCNVYGATETGPFSVALPPTCARDHVGSCGWPAQGVELKLVPPAAADGQTPLPVDGPLASDGVGEICLRAGNIVRTYWPDLPALDEHGWFHTGDLGQLADDGSLTVVGRCKDMVISGGENIYPAEVENLLLEHPCVAECAVLGQPDARWGEVVVAALVVRAGASLGHDQVLAFLKPQLAAYKLPRATVCLPELPKTALGKVRKAELVQRVAMALAQANS